MITDIVAALRVLSAFCRIYSETTKVSLGDVIDKCRTKQGQDRSQRQSGRQVTVTDRPACRPAGARSQDTSLSDTVTTRCDRCCNRSIQQSLQSLRRCVAAIGCGEKCTVYTGSQSERSYLLIFMMSAMWNKRQCSQSTIAATIASYLLF